jgi:hypothetical protein
MTVEQLLQVRTPQLCFDVGLLARQYAGRDGGKLGYEEALKRLIAWAWIAIAETPAGWTDEAYLRVAMHEMWRVYCDEIRRPSFWFRHLPWNRTRVVRAIKLRFFKKKKKHLCQVSGEKGV